MKFLHRLFIYSCFTANVFIFSMNRNVQQRELSSEKRIQQVSDEVYKHLEMDESLLLMGGLARWAAGWYHADNMNGEEIRQQLTVINQSTEDSLKDSQLFPLIMENNSYVSQIVNALPCKVIDEWKEIKGSNIDKFMQATDLFPEIAPEPAVIFFNQVNEHYKKELGVDADLEEPICGGNFSRGTLGRCFFDKENRNMSKIGLKGHTYPVANELLRISCDNRYLRFSVVVEKTEIMSPNGSWAKCASKRETVIWDLETSKVITDSATVKTITWGEGKLKDHWQECGHFTRGMSSESEQFFATIGGQCKCNKSKDRIIYLYARPTLVFRLCQLALMNSKSDYNELNSLLGSKMLALVGGFLKDNLVLAIDGAVQKATIKDQ